MGTKRDRTAIPTTANALPIDLGQFKDSHDLTVFVSRTEHPEDATLRRFKDYVLFAVAIGFLAALFGYCLYVVICQIGSADNIKWSTSILTLIAGGFIGYLTGKSQK